jgi:O-antigen/teichoic acid export membrane protein
MSFVRQFIVYGLGGAASRFAAILLVPLYTRTLPMSEYGRLELLLAIHALVLIFAGMQAESSVARDYFEARESGRQRALVGSAVQLALVGAAVTTLALLVVWLGGWFPDVFARGAVIPLVLLTLPAQLLGVQQVVLRFGGQAVFFAWISFLDLASCAAFSVLYIVVFDMGVAGALWGAVTGKALCVLFAWRRSIGSPGLLAYDREWMRRVLAYGVPSMPAVLVAWLQSAGGRVLLALALTLSDVAIASVAIKVAALYGFLVYSYRLAWEPYSVARFNAVDQDPDIFTRALEWYVLTMFLACGATVLLGPWVTRALAPAQYAPAGTIAVFFIVGQFWVGITNVVIIGVNAARRTDLMLPVYGSGALLMVVLLLVLARPLGVVAAGVAFLAGSMCTAAVALHFGNRHYRGKMNAGLLVITAIATVAFTLTVYAVLDGGGAAWTAFAVGAGALIAATVVIVAAGFGRGRFAQMFHQALAHARGRSAG